MRIVRQTGARRQKLAAIRPSFSAVSKNQVDPENPLGENHRRSRASHSSIKMFWGGAGKSGCRPLASHSTGSNLAPIHAASVVAFAAGRNPQARQFGAARLVCAAETLQIDVVRLHISRSQRVERPPDVMARLAVVIRRVQNSKERKSHMVFRIRPDGRCSQKGN